MKKLLIIAMLFASCQTNTPEQIIETPALDNSTPDTTSLFTPLYPVPVVRVTKCNMDGMKWEVESENGIVFYTNNKPKVGEIVFYMDSESEKIYWIKK